MVQYVGYFSMLWVFVFLYVSNRVYTPTHLSFLAHVHQEKLSSMMNYYTSHQSLGKRKRLDSSEKDFQYSFGKPNERCLTCVWWRGLA